MARGAANTEGFAELDRQIQRVRRIGDLPERVAPVMAEELERELLRQVRSGKGPDGQRLPLTEDGRRPLQSISRGLTVRAIGTTVIAALAFPFSLHHLGQARGGKVRQVLPTKQLPRSVVRALERAVQRVWGRDG